METVVFGIFALVYAGMVVGRLPWLALDRAGIALAGAIAMLAVTRTAPSEAVEALDIPTLSLLFGLMVVSAQFRLSGFYGAVATKVGAANVGSAALLAIVVAVAGGLAALLTNDVIALALAPVLIDIARSRGLNALPFLIGLAAGANVGSAATLVGNPQNILIGEALDLSFAGYMREALVPSLLGLLVVWAVIALAFRHKWSKASSGPGIEATEFNGWQTAKGIVVIVGVLAVFLAGVWPRDLVALGAAGFLLLDRKLSSRRFFALIDWQLLVLFAGLFMVNGLFRDTGAPDSAAAWLANIGADLHEPAWLFAAVALLSNVVSNVPAVMLLLPFADHPLSGPGLAMFSTLAGNLIIVSSIANIIVVDQAERMGVKISWTDHARLGIPITLITLAIAGLWLWLRSGQ